MIWEMMKVPRVQVSHLMTHQMGCIMLKGFYPGSFDPLTFGHLDITRAASCEQSGCLWV